jgi:hypothetical protein
LSRSVSADGWGLVEMFCAYDSTLSEASFQLILQQIYYEMEKRNKIKGEFLLQKILIFAPSKLARVQPICGFPYRPDFGRVSQGSFLLHLDRYPTEL